jgi:hypothetical protein
MEKKNRLRWSLIRLHEVRKKWMTLKTCNNISLHYQMVMLTKKMKSRTNIILNSTCLFFISPILGMMAAGLIVGTLEVLIMSIAGIAAMVASIFFDVDFASIESRRPIVQQIEMWLIFGGGTIGGMIWSILEIKAKWKKHQMDGQGW